MWHIRKYLTFSVLLTCYETPLVRQHGKISGRQSWEQCCSHIHAHLIPNTLWGLFYPSTILGKSLTLSGCHDGYSTFKLQVRRKFYSAPFLLLSVPLLVSPNAPYTPQQILHSSHFLHWIHAILSALNSLSC